MTDSYNVGYSADALGDLREIYSYIANIISTADRTVKFHDSGDGSVDFLCGFFFISLQDYGAVQYDTDCQYGNVIMQRVGYS